MARKTPAQRESMLNTLKALRIRKAVNAVAKDFQLMIRAEAADENGIVTCCSCGVTQHYSRVDAGHFISRANHATIFNERNCHPQCKHCNRFPTSETAARYEEFMQEKYRSNVVRELIRLSKTVKKWTYDELVDLRIEFKARARKAKKRLG